MGKYFTLQELTSSATARSRDIDNTPPPSVKVCLSALINNLLDPAREMWGHPITVNSGFRCPILNKAVGGVPTSQHVAGQAADITAGSSADNRRLFDMIAASSLPFDQLIDEKNYRWLHISYGPRNRRQILHK